MALNSSGEAYFPDVEAKDTPSSVCDSEDRSGYSSGEESGRQVPLPMPPFASNFSLMCSSRFSPSAPLVE